jgi:hypothetical protein
MSKLARLLDARRGRVEQLVEAMGAFERSSKNDDGHYEYAYLAGFYMQQLLTLAADSQESTDTLIRDLQRAVVFKQQGAKIVAESA